MSSRAIIAGFFFLIFLSIAASAQNYEKQATDILKLYESGQKDTAYSLVEPLKQSARFVPAALYVRAQMTPDDRALNLYREVIALEPGGAWADESAYQLVRRYIEKRDSLGAWTWFGMLQKNFPQSPYIAGAKSLLDGVAKWELEMPEEDGGTSVAVGNRTTPSTASGASSTTTTKGSTTKPSTTTTPSTTTGKPATTAQTPAKSPNTAEKPTTADPATTTASDFSGYALQVGIFPTQAAAEKRVKELASGPLRPKIFPKDVKGKTQYALVVGPYKTIEEANKAKADAAKACDCGAFIVTVE